VAYPRTPADPLARVLGAPAALARGFRGLGLRAFGLADAFAYKKHLLSLDALYEGACFRNGGRYDLLHCQFGTLARPVLKHRKAGLLSGKLVVQFRGFDISEHVQKCGPRVYERVFREADWFLANCRWFRDRAVALGCPPDRIDVIPSGVEIDDFPYRARTQGPDGVLRLVSVGRLVEKKGFDDALAAVALLKAAGTRVRYLIVGDGPLRPELEQRARALGLSGEVELLGARNHAGVADVLAWGQLFLAPSKRAGDGAEDAAINTLKEAMAAGLPVVSTRHGGIPELVEHGVTGLLAPEGDPVGLAEALSALAAGAARWPEMGRLGRARVAADYSVGVAHAKLIEAYRRALRAGPPGRSREHVRSSQADGVWEEGHDRRRAARSLHGGQGVAR
jgi:colanic acid/amylovoran biosynthesis glycosyltransferase